MVLGRAVVVGPDGVGRLVAVAVADGVGPGASGASDCSHHTVSATARVRTPKNSSGCGPRRLGGGGGAQWAGGCQPGTANKRGTTCAAS